MIKHFVKILELLGDRLEVCVSVDIYEGKLGQSGDRILSSHITNMIIILVNTNIPNNLYSPLPLGNMVDIKYLYHKY